MDASLPTNADRQLAALLRLTLPNTAQGNPFERLARLARLLFDVPAAQITLLGDEPGWFAVAEGLGRDVLAGAAPLAAHVTDAAAPLMVPDVSGDARFAGPASAAGAARIGFFAGHPILGVDGRALGALCVVDVEARSATPAQLGALADLATLAAQELRSGQVAVFIGRLVRRSARGVVVLDTSREGAPVLVTNPAFEHMMGLGAGELIGRPQDSLYLSAPADGPPGGSGGKEAPVRLARPDGQTLWVERQAVRFGAANTPGERLVVFHTDLTWHLQVEQEKRLLLAVARAMAGAQALSGALRELLRLIAEGTGWQYAEAWLPDGPVLRQAAAWGEHQPALTAFHASGAALGLGPGEGLPGRVWSGGQAEWLDNLGDTPAQRFSRAAAARAAGIQVGLAVPVRAGQGVTAVLAFFKAERQQADRGQIELVSAVAAQLGALIERLHAEEERRKERAAAEAALRALNAELEGRVADRTAELAGANEALRTVAGEFKAILAAFPDMLFRLDPDGVIIDYQAPDGAALYVPPVSFIGRHFGEVLPPQVSARIAAALNQLRRGAGPAAVEYTLPMAGEELTFEARLVAVGEGQTIVVVRDITERARAEALARQARDDLERRVAERTADLTDANRRLRAEVLERRRAEAALEKERAQLTRRVAEHTADLSAANAELARAARLKDEFLANMSHELRTPLNAILGRAELLQEELYGALNDRQRRSVEVIAESGRHLLALINDILDLSKIEAGRIDLHLDPVAVDELCEASLRLVRQAALTRHIQLSYIAPPADLVITADERRLKQVLVNLLSNAVKFTPENGRVGLEVGLDAAAGLLSFTVWDTGIGIAQEELARLFQPFVQLDSELNRRHEGTGLGLALVRRLMDLHGGSVSVESEPGEGSRFTITLPWRPAAARPLPPADSAPDQPTPPGDALILVADDNAHNLELVTGYLAAAGLRLAVAHDGVQAVDQARALRPDLILMDVQMPILSGLEAIARIRQERALAATPIIALTALAMAGDRERCLAAGANDYLAKPVVLAELLQHIRRLLRG